MIDMNISSLNRQQFLAMFEEALKEALGNGNSLIDEGMRYATLDGGKRVRPLCVYFGARSTGNDADVEQVIRLAVGIELIHNYSLVHDDLPAMDNDDYRRGKLSAHKKFGHANGILIGDQLLTQASFVLMDGAREYGSTFANSAQEIISSAKSMVEGQVKDLEGCDTQEQYLDMYSQKTGALIRGAFVAGAICSHASEEQLAIITEYGELIGVAFQLADDVLDDGEEGSLSALIGKERTIAMLKDKTERAKSLCNAFSNEAELRDFADMLCVRIK